MVKKLNKKEVSIFVKLESLHLMKADLKSSLASIDAQIASYELQLQTIDPRKLINGKTWHNGIELYTYQRESISYKNCALELAALNGWSKIPEEIKIKNRKITQSLKTKLVS